MKSRILAVLLSWAVLLPVGWCSQGQAADTVWLSSLDLTKMRQGWGKPQVDRSIRETPLAIGGQKFEHGVGTHAVSVLWIDLAGGTEKFLASVGVDDAAGGKGSVAFKIIGDSRTLWQSGVMKPGQSAKPVELDLHGLQTLLLLVDDAGDGIDFDHADWADARFIVSGPKPRAIDGPREDAVILTPKPSPAPRINGPRVYGARPGHPFLFRIPTSGERPMTFSASGLPAGLHLDAATGILTGTTPGRGTYRITLRARNGHGRAARSFQIVSGDTLALTPPMGWNHWYTHYDRITDALMRQAALGYLTRAGAEIGVASTKAFTTQLTALFLLTLTLAKQRGRLTPDEEARYLRQLRHLPSALSAVLALEPQVMAWAERFADKQNALFLGRGMHYPIALEGALKLKEISYIHAEAYPAGELKHGPLALVTSEMPVVTVAPNDQLLEKLKSNMQEVRARGGELFVFADAGVHLEPGPGLHVIRMPEHYGALSPILHVVPLHLLAYHTAIARGTDVDKPRNLAKSVTVE